MRTLNYLRFRRNINTTGFCETSQICIELQLRSFLFTRKVLRNFLVIKAFGGWARPGKE